LSDYWRGPQFELLPWAVSALDRTARVMGTDGIDARDPSSWAAALFKPAIDVPSADLTEWELKVVAPLAKARGTTDRWQESPLRTAVVTAAGAFQGAGSTPHAIDIARVRASLPPDENGRDAALAKTPKPKPTEAQLRAASVLGLATDLGKLFADLPELAAQELQSRTTRAAHLRHLVGEGFTTDDLVKACNEALQACATWIPAHESDSVRRALEVLRQSKLVQELKRAETLSSEPSDGIESLLKVLGNDASSAVLRGSEPSLTVLANWVKSLEGRLSSDGVQDPLDEATEAHEGAVAELAAVLGLPPIEGEHA